MIRHIAVLLALGLATLAAATTASAGPRTLHAAKTCSLSGYEQRHLGPSYVTSLKVSHTGCTTGKAVVRAYYSCRIHNGGKRGRCNHTVLGYSCSERRSGIKVQFDATVNCYRGIRHVLHTYTQNT